jgi:hypothetical protein
MKTITIIFALTLLTGCVIAPYGPDANYNSPLSAPGDIKGQHAVYLLIALYSVRCFIH